MPEFLWPCRWCGHYPPPCPFDKEGCRQDAAADYSPQELELQRMEQEACGDEA